MLLGLFLLTAYLLTVNTKNKKALKRYQDTEKLHFAMMETMRGDINELRAMIYKIKYGKEETETTEEKSPDA